MALASPVGSATGRRVGTPHCLEGDAKRCPEPRRVVTAAEWEGQQHSAALHVHVALFRPCSKRLTKIDSLNPYINNEVGDVITRVF